MNESAPTVRLQLESSPETLTLVRGMLGGLGELLALDPELLDDLKTAVSEACNNVVMHAYGGEPGPLCACIFVGREGIEVEISDSGRGIPSLTEERLHGVGIPIIRALAQQADFRPGPEGGTEVWMRFDSRRNGKGLYTIPPIAIPEDGWLERLSGDAVVSLSPVAFLNGVLGRLARALAARARFSLDRFSDVYLVTDAIAAHAARASTGARINFGISTQTRRLELRVGPFLPGASSSLTGDDENDVGAALRLLSDELRIEPEDDGDALRLVMVEPPLRPAA